MSLEARIILARRAILIVRKPHLERRKRKLKAAKEGQYIHDQDDLVPAYGCVGLLDYILHDDPSKILEPELKREVKKLIASRG